MLLEQALSGSSSMAQHPASPCPRTATPGQRGRGSPGLVGQLGSSQPFASHAGRGAGALWEPPTVWIEHGADGRTNSAGISVSHNLLPRSLPRLTFPSHEAGLHLEKATRKPGRVSEWQVFCSEHQQGQYTRSQMICLF